MDLTQYTFYTDKLKNALTLDRYMHTIGVAFTAAAMAMKYGTDTDKALLAGLLHDCAKCFSYDDKIALCNGGNVDLTETELANPALIHAKLGAYIAKRDYGITDLEILDAIRTHTTGEPDMGILQKIIFLADLIEPGRRADIVPNLAGIREMAFTDLDECMYMVTKQQVEYLESDPSKVVDRATRDTYYCYREIHDNRIIKGELNGFKRDC